MKKYNLVVLSLVSAGMFSANASAESLFRQGEGMLKVNYEKESLLNTNTTQSGFGVSADYFLTDHLSLGVGYTNLDTISSSGNAAVGGSGNIISGMLTCHFASSQRTGAYIGIGYGSETRTMTLNQVAQPSLSGGGAVVETGLESKFTNNLIGSLSYKGFFLTGSGIPNYSGVAVGIAYMFGEPPAPAPVAAAPVPQPAPEPKPVVEPTPVVVAPPEPAKPEPVPEPAPTPAPAPVVTTPTAPVPQIVEGKFVTHEIKFAPGSDKLKPESENILNGVLELLKNNPTMRFSIEGHTDNQGNPATSQPLSDKRAIAVKKWLVNKGIDAGRLETKGWGEAKPIDTNKTDKGRANNRRVEFVQL